MYLCDRCWALQVTFCVLAAVCNFVLMRRMIARLDADIKVTRRLLLLFPNDTVRGVKVLNDALQDYNKTLLST